MTPFLWSLAWSALGVVAVLAVTFLIALRAGRHSVIDVAWGLGFAAAALIGFVTSAGHGDTARRALVLTLTVVWGVRLAAHIAWRSRGGGEDPRYAALLAKAPGNPHVYALRNVYLTQGVILWFVALPLQVAMHEDAPLGAAAIVGTVLWAAGMFFETVGDLQLVRFKNDPANKGKVLDSGLWRYTRHPNYFGDAVVWWGLFLIACDQWHGLLTVLSPVVMTWLLAKGTGKPLTERRMAKTRPEYADYVARTSGFVPLPPKRTARS
ncbi:DUF1295 domain-containing protein [Spirillospora sp. NPDC047279]|uniref:DUF1295 domain-containing protein n=1 Tax=Spirillospora sp. NPDC047279 TaxID=3155478 RepID=UPI0033FB84A6